MLGVEDLGGGLGREAGSQESLALEERNVAKVSAIHPEEIEGVVDGRLAPEHEVVELRASALVEAEEFAIEDCALGAEVVSHPAGQRGPVGKGVVVPSIVGSANVSVGTRIGKRISGRYAHR